MLPLVVAIVVCLVIWWQVRAVRTARATPALARSDHQAIDQATYLNHLAMARWIEGRLGDDLIRTALANQDHERARKLLQEFYGEEH